MQKHLLLVLTTFLPAILAAPPASADGIAAVHEEGRTVWVNQEEPVQPRTRSVLVYWSNSEGRWKKVPAPFRKPRTSQPQRQKGQAAAEATEELRQPTPAELDALIEETARRHGVDVELVRAVVQVESNFDPEAVSPKGAMGLMQLMPATARRLNVDDPFDPGQNVEGGVRHLRRLLDAYRGDLELSLAAYNAGETAVERNRGVPPYAETQNYVRRIRKIYGKDSGSRYSAPVRVFRDKNGVLTMTNVE